MPDHSEKPSNPNPPSHPDGLKPRRKRFRRFLKWCGVILLVLALFHRPILATVLRLALIKFVARDHISLNLHFSGSFFTNLTVSDISALPNGFGPTPVEKISIRTIHLDYSIPRLLRQGIGAFLNSYEIDDADLVFAPTPSKAKKETEAKKSLAEDLNNILGQPALYADLVRIDNFNLVVRSGSEDTEVKGVHLLFHPWQPGFLRVAKIHIPGLPEWHDLSAETSYAQRNLFVKGLALSPELVVDEFNFDASEKAQNRGSAMLDGRFFGGKAHVEVSGTRLEKKGRNLARSYETTLQADAAGIDVQAAGAYFHAHGVPPVHLGWMTTKFAGEPENPRTWKGTLGIRLEALSLGKVKLDAVELDTAFKDGEARIDYGNVAMAQTSVDLAGTAIMPESINDFSETEADASIRFRAPDLYELTAKILPSPPISGTVIGDGKVGLHQHAATASLNIQGSQISGSPFAVTAAKLNLKAVKQLGLPGKPWAGLTSQISGDFSGLRLNSFTADSAAIDLETNGDTITLHRAEIARAENLVHVQGNYRLPEEGKDFLATPLTGTFKIEAPKLESFGIGLKEATLGGHLQASGTVETAGHSIGGGIQIDGGDFVFGKFKAQTLATKVNVKDGQAVIDEFRLQIDGGNQIAFTGKAGTAQPIAYEGAGLALITNLAVLQPLLEVFGVREQIGGSLDFSVESSGKLGEPSHSGQMKLSMDKARYGKIEIKELRLAGLYGPGFAESSQLRVVTGATSFEGGIEWRENRLKLRDINLRQGPLQVLTGFVSIPFEPQNREEGPVPFGKRIAANVNANQLDIEKLFAAFGQTAPAAGNVTANLVAGGTVVEPFANLKIAAKGLKAKAAPQFDAAELDLTAHYSERELTLDVAARQHDIQPLTIKGRVPLDLQAAAKKKKLDPDLPLDVTLKLPATSLAFLPKVAPSIRSAAGTVAIDAHVSGTVGKPQLAGAATIKIDYARMKSEGVPPIGTLQANLAFSQDSLSVERFHGDVGGGTFDLSGKVLFPKITEPAFDLHLRSNGVLVKRDDSVTVRLDTDLAVSGPLPAGKIAGTVWVVQSRFFRDIDILPIALPGRPKPQPRSAPTQTSVSLGPPLSTWTFDIAVKTRADDPFQIRGNLANGSASLDLKVGGTGKQPWLDGTIHIENFVASLPFSKLAINRGFITFSKDNAFVPKLDISADSHLHDYHINAYIYGSASDPQLSLTSEPPLPQQDIISLLATGATSSELTGKSDVLASRAAVLLFQQLYRKVFKQRDPAENVPLLDRLNVEVGAVDSRTGREEVAATFKLGDQIYLVGDVDVTGAFTGRVKYLLRFR